MAILKALQFATNKLNTGKIIDDSRLEAEILLSHILNRPREYILAHGEKKLTKAQISNFQFLISKRLKGEPAAYLIGHKEFYGLDFKVNKNVLIPRPETELMVEEALELATHGSQPITFVDIGTGSGCVIIALAKLLKHKLDISNYGFWGIDISQKALAVAKQNARAHNINKNIKFSKGDLLSPLIPNFSFMIPDSELIILANLPYLNPSQIKNSPSIKYEPKKALDGGSDGLKYYRGLFKQINKLRSAKRELRKTTVLCEIDPAQTGKITKLVKQNLSQAKPQIKKDLCGLNRLAIVRLA